ncbi:MAG: hypothetical protein IJY71_03225 [Clostridia bacterium]|nr:hypothetical protein [Clostridia bacterium]
MKVLVISHNVFCQTSNMGKTLSAYFEGWDKAELAQIYVHSEVPTSDICHNYFRFTDSEIIKSIFTRKSGTVLTEKDIKRDRVDSRIDTGNAAALYQKARRRTPFIYFARNLWWKLGKWKTKKLLKWVDEFSPDIIFLASGDYAFIYDIALKLAKYKNIPLVVSCMDDYYLYNKNAGRLGGKLVHRRFMKQVNKTMAYASAIYPICDKMAKDYGALFQKPCHVLCTPSTIEKPLAYEKGNAISYIGNLGYHRNRQLIAIGKALKSLALDGKPSCIDVYSAETDEEILAELTEENGICFHGKISGDEVLRIMGESRIVIHTESFNERTRKMVAYSVSTKIADSLASGTCLLAYGPAEIASIEYLKENKAAFCITEEAELEEGLVSLIGSSELQSALVQNALALAKQRHSGSINRQMIKDTLEEIIKQA